MYIYTFSILSTLRNWQFAVYGLVFLLDFPDFPNRE